jgi:hypothetical protein
MIPRLRTAVLFPLLLLATSAVPAAPATLEREFRYDASRFSVAQKSGEALVDMKGAATREFTPGRPDLPVLSEMIELPPGVRATGVEVTSSTELPPAHPDRRQGEARPRANRAPMRSRLLRASLPVASSLVTLDSPGWMRGRTSPAARESGARDPARADWSGSRA